MSLQMLHPHHEGASQPLQSHFSQPCLGNSTSDPKAPQWDFQTPIPTSPRPGCSMGAMSQCPQAPCRSRVPLPSRDSSHGSRGAGPGSLHRPGPPGAGDTGGNLRALREHLRLSRHPGHPGHRQGHHHRRAGIRHRVSGRDERDCGDLGTGRVKAAAVPHPKRGWGCKCESPP